MNTQHWSPLGRTGWISCSARGSRESSHLRLVGPASLSEPVSSPVKRQDVCLMICRLLLCGWNIDASQGLRWHIANMWVFVFLIFIFMGPQSSRGGVPSLQDLMPDVLRWSWCNYNRNKVHNKCNTLESSWDHPPLLTMVCGKIVFPENGPWCQKIGDCCSRELLGDDGGGSGGLVSFLYTGEAGWGNCGRGPTCLVWASSCPLSFLFWREIRPISHRFLFFLTSEYLPDLLISFSFQCLNKWTVLGDWSVNFLIFPSCLQDLQERSLITST